MRKKNAPQVNVVRREQKEQKITEFLSDHLAQRGDKTAKTDQTRSGKILLLARSPESPVAKALVTLNGEIAEAGCGLRVIFSKVGSDEDSALWNEMNSPLAFAREVRIASNGALLDAHEQIVLCDQSSWMGDTMRRDPSRSDAYECYAANCMQSADFATKSFERLWLLAESFVSCAGATGSEQQSASPRNTAVVEEETSDLPVGDDDNDRPRPLAGTRH